MHEVSLGGVLCDYLTGEARDCTTYEDLRQALARYLVEERGYAPENLQPHLAVSYSIEGRPHEREADIAVYSPTGELCLFLVFCPGQVHTYMREVTALARLALPAPSPLAVVTDMRAAELFAVASGAVLGKGLAALPGPDSLVKLAAEYRYPVPSEEQREKESRILHAYTGFLKTCCGEACSL